MLKLLPFFLFFSNALFALYNGNPSAPIIPENGMWVSEKPWVRVKVGYELDWEYDRKLHAVGQGLSQVKKRVEKSDLQTQFGVLTLNFGSRVELFSTLGVLSTYYKYRPSSREAIILRTTSEFVWGVGGRALLAYWGDIQLGINASYLASESSLSSLKFNGSSLSKKGSKMDFSEWQIGMAVSYHLRWFIPYIGVDYCDFRTRFCHLKDLKTLFPSKHITFKDSLPIGLYFGFGVALEKAFTFNFEARFFNQNALSASADFKF